MLAHLCSEHSKKHPVFALLAMEKCAERDVPIHSESVTGKTFKWFAGLSVKCSIKCQIKFEGLCSLT